MLKIVKLDTMKKMEPIVLNVFKDVRAVLMAPLVMNALLALLKMEIFVNVLLIIISSLTLFLPLVDLIVPQDTLPTPMILLVKIVALIVKIVLIQLIVLFVLTHTLMNLLMEFVNVEVILLQLSN